MCNCFACVALIISALIAKWRKGARCGAFQRIFDDGYCKNCSKIRGSCSSRDPARRVSPAGPLCHCFAGIMRSNCALEEGRREERERERGGNKKRRRRGKRKKRRRKKGRKERGTNRVGRTGSIDRREEKEKPSCPPPLKSQEGFECASLAFIIHARIYSCEPGKLNPKEKAFDRCGRKMWLAFDPGHRYSTRPEYIGTKRSNSSSSSFVNGGYRSSFFSSRIVEDRKNPFERRRRRKK